MLEGNEKLQSTCVRLLKVLYRLGRKKARMVCKKARVQFRKDRCQDSVLGNNHLCCFGVEYEQQSSCSAKKHSSTVIKLLQSKVLCF